MSSCLLYVIVIQYCKITIVAAITDYRQHAIRKSTNRGISTSFNSNELCPRTWQYILFLYLDVAISVRTTLLMPEANRVTDLMYHHVIVFTTEPYG